MIQAAETELISNDLAVDDLLRQIDTAWVDDEFSAIIAANWPAEPPELAPSRRAHQRGATPPTIFGCARAARAARRHDRHSERGLAAAVAADGDASDSNAVMQSQSSRRSAPHPDRVGLERRSS